METNMIDPKRMERIWKACPELVPRGLQMEYHPGQPYWRYAGEWVSSFLAEALIRDKCVWWLAANDKEPCLDYAIREVPDECEFAKVDDIKLFCLYTGVDRHREDTSNDPTEACLLAVERVLGLEPWSTTCLSDTHKQPVPSYPPRGR